jgi:osmotically-inducible protein OsmY
MTPTTPTPNNSRQLRKSVLDELHSTSSVNSTSVGVSVDGECATLTGSVPTYPETLLTAKAALHVDGINTVAQELTVR